MTAGRIHSTAIVGARVQLGVGVRIGAYCIVDGEVTIGDRSELCTHVVVQGSTTLGSDSLVYPFAVLGMPPQTRMAAASVHLGEDSEQSRLRIGMQSVVREHVTFHPGTTGPTTIGDNGLFMAGSHIAHDAQIGAHVTLANAVQIAGHVKVGDHVTFGGLAGVAQHVRIGESVFVAAGAMVERDVPPYVVVQGDRAKVRALNKVGLRRRGYTEADIAELEAVFRDVFVGKRAPRTISTSPIVRAFAEVIGARFRQMLA
jgi:UDP-N-acetylglucosamine acyltransferase